VCTTYASQYKIAIIMALTPNHIDRKTFNEILERYETLLPENLRDLTTFRAKELPGLVAERKKDGNSYITKPELVKLVEWKLKHGKFRPKLLSLVQENSAETVKSLTESLFEKDSPESDAVKVVQKLAAGLRGVGPATASLVASVFDMEGTVFFGDEVFRWLHWDVANGSGKGWDRKIKYNLKEYESLVGLTEGITKRLDVKAWEVERVGWVLGKEKRDLDAEVESTKSEASDAKELLKASDMLKTKGAGMKLDSKATSNKKRKIAENQETRRSKRVK